MEHKKLLLIMNPRSGTMQAAKMLADIVAEFNKAGYMVSVLMTQARNDAKEWAKKYGNDYDTIVVSGGDGTFNELVDGLLESKATPNIGYIPSGSTNDFATSLGLPKSILESARRVVEGEPQNLDIGSFNGRHFSYVASFGAFTSTSYSVPQNLKNMLGHAAYMISGVKELANIKTIHAKITADPGTPNEMVVEGDYLFGAICNSTSIAGILKLDKMDVDMNDGLMEIFLIKMPKDIIDLNNIITKLLNNQLNSNEMEFFSGQNIHVEIDEGTHWTLDGEYEEGAESIDIETLRSAIKVIV